MQEQKEPVFHACRMTSSCSVRATTVLGPDIAKLIIYIAILKHFNSIYYTIFITVVIVRLLTYWSPYLTKFYNITLCIVYFGMLLK